MRSSGTKGGRLTTRTIQPVHLNSAIRGASRTSEAEWSDIDFSIDLEPSDEPGVLGRLGGFDVLGIIAAWDGRRAQGI